MKMSNNQAQNSKTAKTLSFGFWHLSLLCFLLFEFGALSLENILIFHFVNGLGVKLTGEKEAKFEGIKREEWGRSFTFKDQIKEKNLKLYLQ